MITRWMWLLPIATTGCIFPEITFDEAAGTGATTSGEATTGTPTSVGPGSSSSSTTGGDGGAPSTSSGGGTTSSSDGGGGGGSSGTLGGGGGSSMASTGPGGPGTCEGDGCDYTYFGAGAGGGSVDCDGDGDPNEVDCQPCNPAVFGDLPAGAYFDQPYVDLQGDDSYDYDCSGGWDPDLPVEVGGCAEYGATCDATTIYAGTPDCGAPAFRQTCSDPGILSGCESASSTQIPRMPCR